MRVLSLFSGVGGFDLGLEAAGMTTVFQCEIDKHCQSVLQHRWPDVPKWDDVSTLTGRHIIDTVGHVDVVAWGSPCQDLSVAGRRAGLAGERSGLFHQGIRIIKELREITNGKSPTWSVWENVYGALSSNGGADFGEVLWEMDEAGACFSEWAVLDAQYFGVPQRRRRVFVASCFNSATADRCSSPLFPVAESGAGDSAKGRKKRQGIAVEVASSVGKFGAIPIQDGREINKNQNGFGVGSEDDPSYTLDQTGAQSVAYPIQGTVIGRSDTAGPQGRGFGDINDPMYTLDSVSLHGVAQMFEDNRRDGPRFHNDVAPSLQSFMGTGGNNTPMIAHDMAVRRLTPVECERLMGWPDDHTAVGVNGPVKDTNRYKMCGNGVASPVATWIGKHLMRCRPNAGVPMLNDHAARADG